MATPPPQKNGKPPAKGAGGMSFLTQKAGPLPVWGWIAVAVVGFIIYKKLQSGSSTGTTTGATAGSAASGTQPTETLTTPYGTYTGPAQGGIPSSILSGPAPTPGPGTSTPGGGGNTPGNGNTPSGAYPGYTLLTNNVAATVQSDLGANQPVFYSGGTGQNLVPVTQPAGAGTGWLFGGSPTAPGNPSGAPGAPSGYYVPASH